ncbi:MAG TPA: membrane protein insertion efficiency factor YidD [Verrucomicrobiae bacterium]|nr:membrane protein insertion efficiency factor YidD [Verrucomicrobiae bacterium]
MKKLIPARVRRAFAFFLLPSSFLILFVRLYRITLSPAKAFLFGPSAQCRFEPSCSQYAIEALKTHGAISGGWLAAKRVCRCHPWGECGEDPVPAVKPKVQNLKSNAPHPTFQVSNFGSRI